jgi:sialic acid synthase SpsE/endonuclease IV
MNIKDHFSNVKNEKKYRYVYVIAEIGINHNGSLKEALRLIDAAYDAGVDAVKFQKRDLSSIYTQKILEDPNSAEWNIDYLIPILKEVELSENDYITIKEKCNNLGLNLIITPFDKKSASFCADLGVDAFKVASADMINFDLLNFLGSFDLPIIVSTGMWGEKDIQKTVTYFHDKFAEKDVCMLLANSTYPTPYESINLNFLKKLKKMHDIVGYSGHERGSFIPAAAAALGAVIIEKHITFDRNQEGPDHKASMLPPEFKEMVENLRNLEMALGDEKMVNQAEILARESFAKSAYALKDLSAGHVLKEEDFLFKSPGKGIFPHEIKDFIGKSIHVPIKKDAVISRLDFEQLIQIPNWKLPKFQGKWGVKCRFHDFEEYKSVNPKVIEFHCSETDINMDFKGMAKDTQLAVHAPEIFGRRLVDICSEDPETVEGSLYLLQKSIDKTISIAKNFSHAKPKFVVHLGGMSLDHVVNENCNQLMLERAIDNFKKLKFNPSDIDVLPENLPPRPWYLGGQWFQYGFMYSEDMIRFCNHFGLKMTYDVCHAALHCHHDRISLDDYTREVMPHVSHLHLSDASGIDGEGVQIGEGQINFDSLFNTINSFKDKSDFSWVTEIWSGHVNHGAGCRKSMHNLSKYRGIL